MRESNLYQERDIIEQGEYYTRHTSAMTGEGLHNKSDIAAELAHRDMEIDRLREDLKAARAEKVAGGGPVGWVHGKDLSKLKSGYPVLVYNLDTPVVFDSKIPVFNHAPAKVPNWIKCSERLPSEDHPFECWYSSNGEAPSLMSSASIQWNYSHGNAPNAEWMCSGIIRPQPPKSVDTTLENEL